MKQKRQVLVNAAMSILQVVVLAGILFVLYRFLLNTIGIEKLGIWSLVLATTAVTRISELGLSASVVKFVAKYRARGESETVAGVIQTAALSVGAFIGLVLLVAYPFMRWLLAFLVPKAQLEAALSILPYAFVSLWIMGLTSVFQAGLDGYQRIDLRSMLLMVGAVLHLLLCFVMVPMHGLMGLAYARVIQAGAILVGSWLLLKRYLELPPIPYRCNRCLLSEVLSYGINFQAASIARMLYEPITKALLTKFGGLAIVGYYEMSSRFILQFRSLLISANQVLVPVIADLQENNPKVIQIVYRDSYRLLFYITLPSYSIIIALTPVISEIWIGHYEGTFVLFSILLAIGRFLSTLSAPAYFANLGLGELRWNTMGLIGMAVLNGGLGLLFGSLYGATAVVAVQAFSLAAGSLFVTVSYHFRHKVPLSELLPRQSIGVGLASVAGLLITVALYHRLRPLWSLLAVTTTVVLAFALIVAIPVWLHPMHRRLVGWITHDLLRAENPAEGAG